MGDINNWHWFVKKKQINKKKINQKNEQNKNQQIKIMKELYAFIPFVLIGEHMSKDLMM